MGPARIARRRGRFGIAAGKTRADSAGHTIRARIALAMFQVTFSDQSVSELNKLDQLAQLGVIEPLGSLTAAQLAQPREPLGQFSRAGHTFYRLRSGDFRFYFERQGDTLHVHWILHRNSLEDFLFRTKLPVTDQQLVEQHSKFWKYLESLTK